MPPSNLDSFTQEDELVPNLNELLDKIHVPIELETPLDLTPSLLIAILESINGYRLPISAAIRESRTLPSKVEAMKVFLGVLENDIIRMDVGLSEVDPRKLAAGDWDEVVFIGELLCWLGKVAEVISPSPENPSATPRPFRKHTDRAMSPSTYSTAMNSANSYLSMSRSVSGDTNTTVLTVSSDHTTSLPELDLFGPVAPLNLPDLRSVSIELPPPRRAQCIHEIDDSSFVHENSLAPKLAASSSYCDCTADCAMEDSIDLSRQKQSPVHSSGWIGHADHEQELLSFEASMGSRHSESRLRPKLTVPSNSVHTPQRPSSGSDVAPLITRHTSPSQYRLALLSERARLLEELAALRASIGKK